MNHYQLKLALLCAIAILFYHCGEKINSVVKPHEPDRTLHSDNTILGKVICGYQGWFNSEGDGAGLAWKHYSNEGKFEPGHCSIDFWADMSEMEPDEAFPTAFQHRDGTPATTFSSNHPKTVDRHFRWMKEYGIDGVFVQRFISTMKSTRRYENLNRVFESCFQSAQNHDRLIGVMYDLSGSGPECVDFVKNDWKQLVDQHKITDAQHENLLTHEGRPLVAIWGVGFNDGRKYTLENIEALIKFFKEDPVYGGNQVLLGVPTYWRTQERDCIDDPRLHGVFKKADILHTWTVGRYSNLEEVDQHQRSIILDKAWCDQHGLDYMPVVFPGFSWHNLRKGTKPLNQIPRLKGAFLWRQFYRAISAEVDMIYVAMFDEMDEGTCIFKCTNDPPVGDSKFADYEGLPSDYYLWLTGKAAAMLREEIPLMAELPDY